MSLRSLDTHLQDAAVDPVLWPRALQAVSTMMGAIGGNFLPITGHVPEFPYSPSLAEAADRYLSEGWIFRDERATGIPTLLRTGTFVDQDIATPDSMARSAYYREFLEPLGLRWFAGLGFRASDERWCLALQRTPQQGFFGPDEQSRLLRLQGPFSRAATMADLLGRARVAGAMNAFETLHAACFLLDRLGRVMRMTTRAEALLGHDVLISKGLVRPTDRARAGDLTRLITAALCADVEPDATSLQTIALRRLNKRPLLVQAQPLRGEARGIFGTAKVVLIMTDLDTRPRPREASLKEAFRLTSAEAKLVISLVNSASLRAAAEDRGITYETARFYLKTLFSKTNTCTQAELFALLARTV